MKKKNGFTLLEVLFGITILSGVLVSLIGLYVYCFDLQETSSNSSFVMFKIREVTERIRGTDFTTLIGRCGNSEEFTFASLGLNLNGRIRVEYTCVPGSGNNLIDIRIIAGWVQRGGRIIGEGRLDADGSYIFDASVPAPTGDGDAVIDSPFEFTTAVSRKTT